MSEPTEAQTREWVDMCARFTMTVYDTLRWKCGWSNERVRDVMGRMVDLAERDYSVERMQRQDFQSRTGEQPR